ncbi:YicC/YloC family endoribonuclease [Akkermansia glycaniphila]|nr:YicC/YloC family endoribonuclease [Akkermansia glycaniphila]OCA01983.1 hypothetical protein AC781_12355 [Akkermansia glycaniphila]
MNSMTGFGAASAQCGHRTLRVEVSGVNRKQAEVAVSLPRVWAELETQVRAAVLEAVSRGRVNVSISFQSVPGSCGELRLDEEKLMLLDAKLRRVQELCGGEKAALTLEGLSRFGVLEAESEDAVSAEEAWVAISPALDEALAAFVAMRRCEGESLKADLLGKIGTLRALRLAMLEQASGVAGRHRETLMKRLEEAGLPLALDDERIVKEIALFADRCDVSEESVRLSSHFDQFEALCDSEEPVGRPLDFLCQEIFRELNTTGSKANDAGLAQLIVTAKTELEKVREQVQNIE